MFSVVTNKKAGNRSGVLADPTPSQLNLPSEITPTLREDAFCFPLVNHSTKTLNCHNMYNVFHPLEENEMLEIDYQHLMETEVIPPWITIKRKNKRRKQAPVRTVRFPLPNISEMEEMIVRFKLNDPEEIITSTPCPSDEEDTYAYTSPLISLYDRYSHKKYNLNLVDNVLYILDKQSNKPVWVCIDDEIFWTDHDAIPTVETVNHTITRIMQQCLSNYTHYRHYFVIYGYKPHLRNTNDKRKSRKQSKISYTPHSSLDVGADLRAVASECDFGPIASNIATALSATSYAQEGLDIGFRIVNIVSHVGAICTAPPGQARNWAIMAALSSIMASSSVRNIIIRTLSENKIFGAQSGELDVLQDSAMLLDGPIFTHLDTLVAVMVTAGLVSENFLTLNGMTLFANGFAKQTSSRDIASRVLKAIHYLGTVGYECFASRSFEPVYSLRDDLSNYAKNVSDLVNVLPSVIQGNYETLYFLDESHFEDMIAKTVIQSKKVEALYCNASQPILTYIRMLAAKLNLVQSDYRMDQLARGSRIRPLCMKFYGDTGVGKSYINQLSIIEVLKANKYPSAPGNICVCTDEKFDTTIKSNSTGLILDDMCNTRPDLAKENPGDKLIRYVNNVCAPAVKADVESKGKVLIMPKVVGITTNCKLLAADYWSINAGSLLRRCDIHVDTYLRKEFTTPTGILDSAKAQAEFGPDEISDIYLLRVQYYDHVTKKITPFIYQDLSGRYPDLHNKPMDGVSIFVFWEWIYDFSAKHFSQQQKLLTTLLSAYTSPRCSKCDRHHNMCACTSHKRKFLPFEPVPVDVGPSLMAAPTPNPMPVGPLGIPKHVKYGADEKEEFTHEYIDQVNREFPPGDDLPEMITAVDEYEEEGEEERSECDSDRGQDCPTVFSMHSGTPFMQVMGFAVAPITKFVYTSVQKCLSDTFDQMRPRTLDTCCQTISDVMNPANYLIDYHDKWYAWNNLLPDHLRRAMASTYVGRTIIATSARRSGFRTMQSSFMALSLFAAPVALYNRKSLGVNSFAFIASAVLASSWAMGETKHHYLCKRLMQRDSQDIFEAQVLSALKLTDEEKRNHSKYFKWALTGSTLVGIVAVAAAAFANWNSVPGEPHSLSPSSAEEYSLGLKRKNTWSLFGFKDPLPSTTKTTEQLVNTVQKNLRYIQVDHGEGTSVKTCNALWLRYNELMIPKHMFYPNDDIMANPYKQIRYRLTRSDVVDANKPKPGSTCMTWSSAMFEDVREISRDWVVLDTHRGSGDVRNLTLPDDSGNHFFSLKKDLVQRKQVVTAYRNSMGKLVTDHASIDRFEDVNIRTAKGSFSLYCAVMAKGGRTWSPGDCGTVLIDNTTKSPTIVGFHLYQSDSGSERNWYSYAISRDDIDAYLEKYPNGIFKSHSVSAPPDQIYGYKLGLSQDIPVHSPCNYTHGCYDVLGHIKGNNHYKTNFRKSVFHDVIKDKFPHMKHSPPNFKDYRPFDDYLHECSNHGHCFDKKLLRRASDDYLAGLKPCYEKCKNFLGPHVKPLSNKEILNGKAEVKFIDRMKGTSAMGYPMLGPRHKNLVDVSVAPECDIMDWRDTGIWLEFERLHATYASGYTLSHPFKATLKDEIRVKDKGRVFLAAPHFPQLFIRKYFTPIGMFLSTYPLESECAVGMNPISMDWQEMEDKIIKFGADRRFAADHGKWDMRYEQSLAEETYYVLLTIAKWFGYSDEDLRIMEGISVDLMNVVVFLFGSLVRLYGPNPSGHNMTVYVNSVGNSILVRYVFFKLEPLLTQFKKHVSLITYGDDLKIGVSKDCRLNFNTFRETLMYYGKVVTLPTKVEYDVYPDFAEEKDLDFLKRTTVYIPELGYKVGALEPDSIWKQFLYYDTSSTVTEHEVMRSCINNASNECAAHGRDYYDVHMKFLNELALREGINTPVLRESYDDKIAYIRKHNMDPVYDYSVPPGASQDPLLITSAFLTGGSESNKIPAVMSKLDADRHTNLREKDHGMASIMPEIGMEFHNIYGEETPSDGMSRFTAHAEEISTGDSAAQTAAITSFSVGDDGEVVHEDITVDPTKMIGMTPDVSLADFLARPIVLNNFSWTTASNPSLGFNPVSFYLQNPYVLQKVSNYTFLTGTFHIKAVVTGTAFHYGKLIMAYEPYGQQTREPALAQLSCLPYVTIDPNDEAGGTISFRFMTQHNYVDLTKHATFANRVAWLWVKTINPLIAMSTTTTSVGVVMYAWMTDVKLGVPTLAVPNASPTIFTAQSGELTMPSQNMPATDVLSRIYSFPVLGKYLKASVVAARAGIEIASMFGYSKPCVYKDDVRAVPTFMGNYTHCNAYDSSNKLSMDHKAEVFVDNVVTGSTDINEMDFVAIGKRECLLASQGISSLAAAGDSIFFMNVTPCVSAPVSGGGNALTPSAHVAGAFRHWRGTMKIRLEFVASPFHRGKIRICWDPRDPLISPTSTQTNVFYNHVVDLSESRNYSFCVGWGSHQNYLNTNDPTTLNTSYSNGLAYNSAAHNGRISVQMVTPFTVGLIPQSTASVVYMNVYTCMCDDFEVAVPYFNWMRTAEMYIVPDAARPAVASEPVFKAQASDVMSVEKASRDDVDTLCLNKVPEYIDGGELSGIHFGERIRSVRQVIKRYCVSDMAMVPSLVGEAGILNWTLVTQPLPWFRRYVPSNEGPNYSTAGGFYTYAQNTYLNWFLPAYVGYRGSMRWKYMVMTRADKVHHHSLHLSQLNSPYSRGAVRLVQSTGISEGNEANFLLAAAGQSVAGQAIGFPHKNPVLEIEVPYYGLERFKTIDTLNWTFAQPQSTSNSIFYNITYDSNDVETVEHIPVIRASAAGDDFSLVYYKFGPVVYKRPTPTPL